MTKDAEEVERLIRTERRMRRIPAESERIPRPNAADSAEASGLMEASVSGVPRGAMPEIPVSDRRNNDDPGTPIAKEDDDMLDLLQSGDEDNIPVYVATSYAESEKSEADDSQRPSKRARADLFQALNSAVGTTDEAGVGGFCETGRIANF